MKKTKISFLLILLIIILIIPSFTVLGSGNSDINLTSEEKNWLREHKDISLTMGITPYTGMEYFFENGIERGYLQEFVNKMNQDLGTNIVIKAFDWKDMLPGLKNKDIDIVVGANETAKRKTFMAFTEPLRKIPYALFSLKNVEINNIGDIDNKTVAFLEDDIVINMMENKYPKLIYNRIYVKTPDEAFAKMEEGKADAFINSGEELIFELLRKHPSGKLVSPIDLITSDITLSTRLEDKTLTDILSKEIAEAKIEFLPRVHKEAKPQYVRKVINITSKERKWLEEDGKINVGVNEQYLPFDYLDNNEYKGITGEIVNRFAELIGAEIIPHEGERGDLLKSLYDGNIDMLGTTKTEESMKNALFTAPFYTERDLIYGNSESADILNLYGLEGKKIAVVKGSPQKYLLFKNLIKPNIVDTGSVEESIRIVSEGKADYLVESSIVVRYYSEEMGNFSLVSKGTTNTDSYNYIAINKNKPEIASLFNKVLPLIDIEKEIRDGYQSVPHNETIARNNRLLMIIFSLIAVIIIALPIAYFIFIKLLKERTEKEVLIQKEKLLYVDSLTGLYNKHYFDDKLKPEIDNLEFPQALIIFDMNNLKDVNDNFGHMAGDISLKVIGEIIKEVSIKCDAFRFGGDEFLVVLLGEETRKVKDIQDRIDVLCENRLVVFPTGERIHLKIASGNSRRENADISYEEMFRDADKKMYEDKRYKKTEKG